MATALQANSFGLKWKQSDGADAVASYNIKYCFTINECQGVNKSRSRCFSIHKINGSQRSYNIMNSSDHSIEEDSTYDNISLIAVNSVTSSEAVKTVGIVTDRTCMYILFINFCMLYHKYF